jgi:hypothetical protein
MAVKKLDDYITSATTGATDSTGITDYTLAILALLADGPNNELVMTDGATYGFAGATGQNDLSRQLLVQSNTRIIGYGAKLVAMEDAGPTTHGLWISAADWVSKGPSGVRIQGLTIDQRAPLRRSRGVITSTSPQGDAAIRLMCADNFLIEDVTLIDSGGDGVYSGGSVATGWGGWSTDGLVRKVKVINPGRNCFSVVGSHRVHGEYNFAEQASFGHSVGGVNGGLSTGYDFEPNDSWTQNNDCVWSYCSADLCADEGFASRAYNSRVRWFMCNATRCGIGYFSVNPDTGGRQTKAIAASFGANSTNFSGIVDSIAGY